MWNEEQQQIIAQELREIEIIADSLQREIGNEATLELVDRVKILKRITGNNDRTEDSKETI